MISNTATQIATWGLSSLRTKIENRTISIARLLSVNLLLRSVGHSMRTQLRKKTENKKVAFFFVYDDIDSIYLSALSAIELSQSMGVKPVFLSFTNFSRNVDILAQTLSAECKDGLISFIKIGKDSPEKGIKRKMSVAELSEEYKKFEVGGIPVGDLIIDAAIRTQEIYPSSQIMVNQTALTEDAATFVSAYRAAVESFRPDIAFLIETGYIGLGTLERVLFENQVPTFQLHPSVGLSKIDVTNKFYGTGLIYSRAEVDKMLTTADIPAEDVKTYYDKRIAGEANDVGAQDAYSVKSIYSKNLKSGRLLKVLYLHAFKDMNHFSYQGEARLFETYLEWAKHTIRKISDDASCDWIIKIHPGSYMYDEDRYTERFVKEVLGDIKPHVRVISDEIPSADILKSADIIYTFDGTIAVEFACLGKVSVCLGNRYWDYPFSIVPKNLAKYNELITLSNINLLPGLTSEDIDDAKKLLYVTYGLRPFSNHIGTAATRPNPNDRSRRIKETTNAMKLLKSFIFHRLINRESEFKLSTGITFTQYLKGIE